MRERFRWMALTNGVFHACELFKPVTAPAYRHVTACGQEGQALAEMDDDGRWVCRRCRKLVGDEGLKG